MRGLIPAGSRRARSFGAVILSLLLSVVAPAYAQTVIRVNAGGPAYTDTAGHGWSADTGFNSGTVFTNNSSIAGTSDPTLYRTGRFDDLLAPPTLEYTFTVPNGPYEVRLLIAEVPGIPPGYRHFDIALEGETVFADVDISAEAGVNTAVIKKAIVAVIDGQLNIQLLHGPGGNDDPLINAIEIVSSSSPTTPVGLSAVARTGTEVTLSWTASTDDTGVALYRVERCQGAACTSFAEVATPTATSYLDNGVTPQTTYRYRVRAVDTDGNISPYSYVVSETTPSSPFATIRVNAGGPAYTDSAGQVWSADTGYNSGIAFTNDSSIAGTSDPTLYRTGRFDDLLAPPTLEYSFGVLDGVYEVRLFFAELPGISAGFRRFDIALEGATAFSNVDLSAEAGVNKALIKKATIAVVDGDLNIQLLHGLGPNDDPFVNAIEIVSSTSPATPVGFSALVQSATQVTLAWIPSTDNTGVTRYRLERCQGPGCTAFTEIATPTAAGYVESALTPQTTYRYRVRAVDTESNLSSYSEIVSATTFGVAFAPIRVNVGGLAYTDSAGHVWSADVGYNSGIPFENNSSIAGTSDPTLYRTGRYDDVLDPPTLEYGFAVPNGSYTVRLLFAELPAIPPGYRRFDVMLEETTIFTDVDLSAEAGVNNALIKTATTTVVDNDLKIRFLHGPGANDDPFVNAIEITQVSAADGQAPAVPGSVSAQTTSSTRVSLTWSASTDDVGVTAYRIERCQGVGCTDFAEVATVAGTLFADETLAPSTTYRYRVRAADAAQNVSGYSAAVTAATFILSDAQPPSTPGSLNASATSATQIALNWSASSDNVAVTGYRIERCSGTGCSSFVQVATTTGTSFSDIGLVPGTVYRYRVRAVDAVPNVGAYSSIASATTSAGGGDTESPSTPSSVSASVLSAGRIDLSWGASNDNVGVVGYVLERCTGAGCSTFSQIAALSAVTTYLDTGLAGGTTYRYRIRATDAQGNASTYSAIVTATTASGTGRAGNATYQYDSFGRLKQVTVTPQ